MAPSAKRQPRVIPNRSVRAAPPAAEHRCASPPYQSENKYLPRAESAIHRAAFSHAITARQLALRQETPHPSLYRAPKALRPANTETTRPPAWHRSARKPSNLPGLKQNASHRAVSRALLTATAPLARAFARQQKSSSRPRNEKPLGPYDFG